ncbi:unnamed protein product [Orchesella dallaii]|uniref:Retrotransposon gag domain-containing protein n=1 Tax=Orchesella dallaii TaxID=48710 RepID=A0ABP1RG20_9HEXA
MSREAYNLLKNNPPETSGTRRGTQFRKPVPTEQEVINPTTVNTEQIGNITQETRTVSEPVNSSPPLNQQTEEPEPEDSDKTPEGSKLQENDTEDSSESETETTTENRDKSWEIGDSFSDEFFELSPNSSPDRNATIVTPPVTMDLTMKAAIEKMIEDATKTLKDENRTLKIKLMSMETKCTNLETTLNTLTADPVTQIVKALTDLRLPNTSVSISPPTFNPRAMCADTYLNNLEIFMKGNHIRESDYLGVVKPYLSTEGQHWFTNNSSTIADWTTFRQKFEERFDDFMERDKREKHFHSKRQRLDDPTEEFIYETLELARSVYPGQPEEILVRHVQRALYPRLALAVGTDMKKTIQSLISACAIATESLVAEDKIYKRRIEVPFMTRTDKQIKTQPASSERKNEPGFSGNKSVQHSRDSSQNRDQGNGRGRGQQGGHRGRSRGRGRGGDRGRDRGGQRGSYRGKGRKYDDTNDTEKQDSGNKDKEDPKAVKPPKNPRKEDKPIICRKCREKNHHEKDCKARTGYAMGGMRSNSSNSSEN